MKRKPRILVFASGDAKGGGSGFKELVEFTRTVPVVLDAEIVGVISNHPDGGVAKKARELGVNFYYWAGPFTFETYQSLVAITFKADYVMCSGWLKKVSGLNPARTINIHPGPLPKFGGPGKYGHHVHELVKSAYDEEQIEQSAVTMHFVNDEYDRGPIFFQLPILIRPEDDANSIGSRVNEKERAWQAFVLNLVVHEEIAYWDNQTIKVTKEVHKIIGRFISGKLIII